MTKDRDQQTPDDPEDWARLQLSRGTGTGGTGYDRLVGETSRPPLHDRDSFDETIPNPIGDPYQDDAEDVDHQDDDISTGPGQGEQR